MFLQRTYLFTTLPEQLFTYTGVLGRTLYMCHAVSRINKRNFQTIDECAIRKRTQSHRDCKAGYHFVMMTFNYLPISCVITAY